MKIGLGMGLLVCVLVPVALLLFGIVDDAQTASLVLFLGGLWTAIFGLAIDSQRNRLYDVGFGLIVMVFSTFIFLPLQYTAGLVVVAIVAVILVSLVYSPRTKRMSAARPLG